MDKEREEQLSEEEINQCTSILEKLVADSNQLFDLPEDKRVALLKAAGKLSRPDRAEFIKRKKDGKKGIKQYFWGAEV